MNYFLALLIFLTTIKSIGINPTLSYWFSTNPTFSSTKENIAFTSYSNSFFLKEMNQKSIGLGLKLKPFNFWFRFSRFGTKNYNQNKTTISAVKSINPQLKLGIGLQSFFINQLEFNQSPMVLKPQLGLTYQFDDKNTIYSAIHSAKYLELNSYYPEVLSFQWEYKLNDLVSSLISVDQMIDQRVYFIGLNISPNKAIDLFIQTSNSETPISLTTQINKGDLMILLTNTFHQKLGLSNRIGIALKW